MKFRYFLILSLLIIAGCQPQYNQSIQWDEPRPPRNINLHSDHPVNTFPLTDQSGQEYGIVYVQADEETVRVTFVAACGWLIENSYLYLNACEDIPSLASGYPIAHSFPHYIVCDEPTAQHTYEIELGDGDHCFCIVTYAEMLNYNASGCIIDEAEAWAGDTYYEDAGNWHALINYCPEDCDSTTTNNPDDPDDPDDPDGCKMLSGEFRTQTQGGWGSTPSGANPGVYLHDNFNAAFPNGIVIGCGNTITLTSAQSVTDFIPQGGSPVALTQNYTNPTQALSVLAGQVLALTLSTAFDNYDEQFSTSYTALENLVIVSGTMSGQTIAYALDQGNRALGGCSASYTITEINEVLSKINENFIDGTQENAYMRCP